MEIERKFLVSSLPTDLETYPVRHIEQGYLSTDPVIRVRKDENEYYLTYKGSGLLAREEHNLPLTENSFQHLIEKCEGFVIRKSRYMIPIEHQLTVELDIFEGSFSPLIVAEVEFNSVEEANAFTLLPWFKKDVTNDRRYSNSSLSVMGLTLFKPEDYGC